MTTKTTSLSLHAVLFLLLSYFCYYYRYSFVLINSRACMNMHSYVFMKFDYHSFVYVKTVNQVKL